MRERDRIARKACVFLTIVAIIGTSCNVAMGSASYKVRRGDTIWDIAHKQHVSVGSLLRANGLSEKSTLKLGRTLVIPGKIVKKTTQPASKPAPACKAVSASAKVRSDNVCLRSGASTRHGIVANLKAGTEVRLIGAYGDWRKVVTSGGARGFVYRPLLIVAGSATDQAIASRSASSGTSSASDSLIRTALSCRGARYHRGGTSRGGFDCSGFTRYVFAKYGVSLPHSSAAQARLGTPVPKSDLKSGDLVFFQTYRRGVSHVGIYVGNGQFVHASTHRGGVRVDSLSQSYYVSRYRGARRVR